MSEHTPLPWCAPESEEGDIWCGPINHPNAPLFRAARDYRRWGREISNAEHIANAAFIVRAVNSHDDLVKALEALLEAAPIDSEWGYCGCCQRKREHENYCPIPLATAALAKARGEA